MKVLVSQPVINDSEIVKRAQSGDSDAFGELYTLHYKKIYRLCLRMVGDHATAEDLAQEAFIHVFRKLGTFRGDSQFSTWFYRLTLNLILAKFRVDKTRSHHHISMSELVGDEEDGFERQFVSIDHYQAASVERVALERAVARLPPGYRMVFILFDVDGMTYEEIGHCLGKTTGCIKSQLHKARKRLRETLGTSLEPLASPVRIWAK